MPDVLDEEMPWPWSVALCLAFVVAAAGCAYLFGTRTPERAPVAPTTTTTTVWTPPAMGPRVAP